MPSISIQSGHLAKVVAPDGEEAADLLSFRVSLGTVVAAVDRRLDVVQVASGGVSPEFAEKGPPPGVRLANLVKSAENWARHYKSPPLDF